MRVVLTVNIGLTPWRDNHWQNGMQFARLAPYPLTLWVEVRCVLQSVLREQPDLDPCSPVQEGSAASTSWSTAHFA